MEELILVNGSKIKEVVQEFSHGLMASDLKENIVMAREIRVLTHGQVVSDMRVSSRMTREMAMVSTRMLMEEYMKAIGRMTRKVATVFSHFLMAIAPKESGRKTKRVAMVYTLNHRTDDMRVFTKMIKGPVSE